MGFFSKVGSFAFKSVFNPKKAAEMTLNEVGSRVGDAMGAFTAGMAGEQPATAETGVDLGDDKARRTALFETEGGILGEEVENVKKRDTILGN